MRRTFSSDDIVFVSVNNQLVQLVWNEEEAGASHTDQEMTCGIIPYIYILDESI